MKGNAFRLSVIASAVFSCWPGHTLAADNLPNSSPEVEKLRQELQVLTRRYESQNRTLQELSSRLRQLEASGSQVKPVRAVRTGGVVPEEGEARADNEDAPNTQAAGVDTEDVVKEAPSSRSAQAVYREQNALFNRTFTLETGISYTHSDRRELILNGFLALDAIFLGNISLDRVKSDIVQFDVTGRYGYSDRLQFDFNAPFLYRESTFQSGGVGGSAATLGEEDVRQSDVGDVSAGIFYRLFTETATSADMILSLRAKAPTGKDPFGIKIVDVNNDLQVPEDLPTGNGVWSVTPGVTFVKTVDPAILFASASYTYNIEKSFSDISSRQGEKVSGDVDLGDSVQLGAGIAYALNDRLSTSISYSHRFAKKSRIRSEGADWQSVIGSDASAGLLNFGVNFALTDRLTMVSNVGIGITPDAPDITVGVKFPYNF